jgi:HEAT repeat protein
MKHLVIYRPHFRFGLALLAVAVIATALAVFTQRTYGYDQDIAKLNSLVQTKPNTASMQIFREGRDLIEAQNWQKAAEKFNDFITAYPKNKDIDAALYWYGYALQKQDRKEEAAVPLVRLITNFPNSTWRREADALLVVLGRKADVDNALQRDNCEIKMLALQSLFQADQDKAIAIASEALRANPGQCQNFQAATVSLLGSHGGARAVPILLEIARSNPDQRLRLTAIKRLGDQQNEQVIDDLVKIYDADRTKEIRAQILRALVDSHTQRGNAKLLEIARAGDDLPTRAYAIRFISERDDPTTLDELIRIYDADKTKEIRSQIMRVLAERDDPRARTKLLDIARQGETPELRMEAIRRLGDQQRIAADDLLTLYTSETNPQIKYALLRALAASNDPRARGKLSDVARGNDPIELRGYAIRQLGEKDDEQTTSQLVSMYDSEQNPQLRMMLIRAFSESKQKNALHKLMAIARNDQSMELRKAAIRYLGESKDPEALKFLEDFLKQ